MGKVRRKVDPRFEKVVKAWHELRDDEQEKLLPHLLDSLVGWRAFSVSPQAQQQRLESMFKEAGVPIRDNPYAKK
jgi:hypothetical protein